MNGDTLSQQFVYSNVQVMSVLPPKPVGSFNPCSCLSYVKYKRGITEILGTPKRVAQGKTSLTAYEWLSPTEGLIVILSEGPVWHVAYIEEVYDDGTMLISEANYLSCKRKTRVISQNDEDIIAYF